LFVGMVEGGHALLRPSVPDNRDDFFSAFILGNQQRRDQVRATFAASGVASVAEAALRREQSLTSL
jgi:hypothetical protein